MTAKLVAFVVVAGLAFAASLPYDCSGRCAEDEETKDACQRGCRFYGYHGGVAGLIQGGGASVLEKCNQDCGDGYNGDEAAAKACRKGCSLGSEAPRDSLIGDGLGDGGLTVSFGSLPAIFDFSNLLGRPRDGGIMKMFDIPTSVEHERSDVARPEVIKGGERSIFDEFRNLMGSMMSRPMFGGSDGDTSMPVHHSGGELVVIKSGPGYREEKKYHLGPNANIEKILEHSMDDMMEHKNPIEKFGEMNDIEVFNPAEFLDAAKSEAENGDNVVVRANNLFDTDPWGFIRGNGIEGPRLPETGLKSQHTVGEPWEQEPEARSSRTWTDWLTHFRMRMGLPTWLMAASVALGVIFTLWLCMVIPSSAPKQKAKRGKMIGTKEAEAEMGISTVVTGNYIHSKVDLPPPYDDVANRGDPEPVHGLLAKVALEGDSNQVAAGSLPEKNDKNLA